MKYIRLNHAGNEIAVNKDSIAYVTAINTGGTKLYFRSTDEKGNLIHKYVSESYDDVLTMLNAD